MRASPRHTGQWGPLSGIGVLAMGRIGYVEAGLCSHHQHAHCWPHET